MVGAGMMFRALHPDTDVTAVRDAADTPAVIDNSVSAAAVSEDEKQLLDDVASEGDVSESQPANETHDLRQRWAGVEEAARPPGKEPESYTDEQQEDLLHARKKEEEDDQDKADENLELGDREEVSGGDIIAPASPASGESNVTGEGSAVTTADDEQRAEAAAEGDQERAEAAARAGEESHQQAAADDKERFGCPAEDSDPADETWLEDDADVNDPDID